MTDKSNSDASVRLLAEKSDQFTDRLKVVIKRIGGVTKTARKARVAESTVRSWRDGNSDPQRQHIIPLAVEAGVSIAWLVAGQPPMLQEELVAKPPIIEESAAAYAAEPAPVAPLNMDLMTLAIAMVETVLLEKNQIYQPEKKAELISDVYGKLLQEEGNIKNVIRLKLVNSNE